MSWATRCIHYRPVYSATPTFTVQIKVPASSSCLGTTTSQGLVKMQILQVWTHTHTFKLRGGGRELICCALRIENSFPFRTYFSPLGYVVKHCLKRNCCDSRSYTGYSSRRPGVPFPTPTLQLTAICNSSSKGSYLASLEHQIHTQCAHIHANTYLYT